MTPALPAGFELDEGPAPPLPPGFQVDDDARRPLLEGVRPSEAGAGRGNAQLQLNDAEIRQVQARPKPARPFVGGDARAVEPLVVEPAAPRAEPVPANTYASAGPSGALADIRANEAARTLRQTPILERPAPQNPGGSMLIEPGLSQREMTEGSMSPEALAQQKARAAYLDTSRSPVAKPLDTAGNIAQDVREFTKNPVARGAVAGFSQLGQTGTGALRLAADIFGADSVARFAAGAAGGAETIGQGATAGLTGNDKLVADVTSSIMNSAPALAVGTLGGPALTTLFAQSTLAEYNSGRDAGHDVGSSLARAGIMGFAEALGERFGLPEQIKLLKSITKDLPTGEVAKAFASMFAKEIPGEQLTTAIQFLADKAGPAALKPNATMADYLEAAGETLKLTVAQTAVMGGGPAALSQTRTATRQADAAVERSAMTLPERAAADKGFIRPTERRKQAFDRFDDLAAEHGLPPKATQAAKTAAESMPLAEVPGFMKRFAAALTRRMGRPLDDAALTVLDEPAPVVETPPEPAAPPAPEVPREAPPAAPTIADRMAAALGIEPDARTTPGDGAPPQAPAAPEPAADEQKPLAGAAINKNWTAFAPESGTLDLPRDQMPQIAAEHRGALVNFLNARGIAHQAEEVAPDTLKPTQREFSPKKVDTAAEFTGGDRSILVSQDDYILDGTHQWLAKVVANKPVKVIRLDAPIQDLLRLAHQFPSSTTARGASTRSTNESTPAAVGAEGSGLRSVDAERSAGDPGAPSGPTESRDAVPAVSAEPANRAGQIAPDGPRAGTRLVANAGRTPNSTEPLTLRTNPDGTLTPQLGKYELLDSESGEPLSFPADISDIDAKKAIRDAKAVGSKVNFFPPKGQATDDQNPPSGARAEGTQEKAPAGQSGEQGNPDSIRPFAGASESRDSADGSVAKPKERARPKVYGNRKAAQAARDELGNTHKLQKFKGGFILRQKTDKELAAEQKGGDRLKRGSAPNVDKTSLLGAIGKLGGLAMSEKRDTITEGNKNAGGRMVFRKEGKPIDIMATALHEDGYIPPSEYESDGGVSWLQNAIAEEFSGQRQHFSQSGEEWMRAAYEAAQPLEDVTLPELRESGYMDAEAEVQAITEAALADAEDRANTELRELAADMAADWSENAIYEAAYESAQAAEADLVGSDQADDARSNAGAAQASDADNGKAAGDQGKEASQGLMRGTEEEAKARGFTLKAYRGVSRSKPFNDTDSTWLTTDREVAEAYAEEVMSYDDPGVLTVFVNPDNLPRHDASRLTDEQLEELGADDFGNPQAQGIYSKSDDHPLGGSHGGRSGVTVIHAPKTAVFLLDEESRPDLTLTAPTQAQVLAQEAALEKERADKEAPADKQASKLTGEQVDIFNTQASVFDAPAEAETPAAPTAKPDRPEALIALRKRASVLESLRKCL